MSGKEGEHADVLRRLRKEQKDRHAKKGNDQTKDGPVEPRKKRTKDEKMAQSMGRGQEEHHRSTASRSKKRRSKPSSASSGMKSLPVGFEIKGKSGQRYKVEAQIADRVYVARNKKTEKMYAMKVEMNGREDEFKQLKRDVFMLMDASKHQARFSRHFPRLHNKGRMQGICNYVMMTLCDYNLNDLRTNVLEGCDFSRPNAARMCMQTFQAIHDLHSLGFIHRDISPTKFVLGLDNPHIVYMIGFSTAYHFEQRYETKPSTSPRRLPKVANRTFLSRGFHRSKDMHRKDDLESWVYLCFNLFGRRILPWNEQFSDLNMFVNKERLFCDGFEECFKYVPRQFQTIMHNLDKLGEGERPDYTFIGMMLVTMKESIKFHFYGPFDWQKKHGRHVADEKEDGGALAVADKDEERAPVPNKHDGKRRREAFHDDDEDDSDGSDAGPPADPKKERKQKKKKPSVEDKSPREEEVEPNAAKDKNRRSKQPPPSVMQASSSAAAASDVETKAPPPRSTPAASAAGPSNAELLAQMEAMRQVHVEMAAKLAALTAEKQKAPAVAKTPKKKAEELEKEEAEGEDDQTSKKSDKKPPREENEGAEEKPPVQESGNPLPKPEKPSNQQASEFVMKNLNNGSNSQYA